MSWLSKRWRLITYSILFLGVACSVPSVSVAQNATVGDRFLPSDGFLGGRLDFADLFNSEAAKLYQFKSAEAWCKEHIGIQLSDVQAIKLAVATPGQTGAMFGAVLRFKQPVALKNLNPKFVQLDQTKKVDGYDCVPITNIPDSVLHQLRDDIIVLATENYLGAVIRSAKGSTGALAKLATHVPHTGQVTILVAVEPIRPIVNGMVQTKIEDIPSPLVPLTQLADLLEAIAFRLDVENKTTGLQLTMLATDEDAAEKVKDIVNDAINLGRKIFLSQMQEKFQNDGAGLDVAKTRETKADAERIANRFAQALTPKRSGRSVTISGSPLGRPRDTRCSDRDVDACSQVRARRGGRSSERKQVTPNRTRALQLSSRARRASQANVSR